MQKEIIELVASQVNAALSPDSLQEIIKKNVESAVKSAIDDLFQWSGPVKKQISEFIKENVCFDSSKLTLPNYNDIILAELKDALSGMKDTYLKEKAKELIDSYIEDTPKTIKASEILKLYKDYLIDIYKDELIESTEPDEGEYNFYIEVGEEEQCYTWSDTWVDISFYCEDLEGKRDYGRLSKSDRHAYRGAMKLHFAKYGEGKKQYKINHALVDGKSSGGRSDLTNWDRLSELERMLYKLDKNDTEIIMDLDSVDKDFSIPYECEC